MLRGWKTVRAGNLPVQLKEERPALSRLGGNLRVVNPVAFGAVPLPQASFWNFTGPFLSQDLGVLDGSQEYHKSCNAQHRPAY